MITIIIADDHQMFIDGIKVLLEEDHTVSIVGEVSNGRSLLNMLERQKADIILMDINMPLMNGIVTTKIIRKKYPSIKILMLTMYSTRTYITSMLTAGASGYILKNTGKDELIRAVKAIHEGGTYYSQDVIARVMENLRKKDSRINTLPELTSRENEVLQLLAQDLTANEIAKRLNISHYTVEAHRKNMLIKFNARTTLGLVKLAVERGLIE